MDIEFAPVLFVVAEMTLCRSVKTSPSGDEDSNFSRWPGGKCDRQKK